MEKRVVFNNPVLPYLLLAPQIVITLVFFIWPAMQALRQSVRLEDPFGLRSQFVGLDNFIALFTDPLYLDSLLITAAFCVSVSVLTVVIALFLALLAARVIHGPPAHTAFLIRPTALAPAAAGD